ncbi:hypothetical protein BHE74_00007680 [Ensete ventricosum]|nr:hypothetical protein BHE74_00007680 [Ensete ventricosum]
MAAESYTLAASSAVLNVSSHTRTRIQKSRIVAANFPHDHRREQRISKKKLALLWDVLSFDSEEMRALLCLCKQSRLVMAAAGPARAAIVTTPFCEEKMKRKKGEERVLRLDSVAGMVGQHRRCCGQPRAAAAANGSAVVEAGAEESRRLRLKRRRELSFDSEKKLTPRTRVRLCALPFIALVKAGVEEVELVMRPDMDLGMYGSRYGNGPGGGSAGGYDKPLVMGVGNGSCCGEGEGAGAGNGRGYGKSGGGDGVGEKIL